MTDFEDSHSALDFHYSNRYFKVGQYLMKLIL